MDQHEEGVDFQTAGDHGQGEGELGQIGQAGIGEAGAEFAEGRADVVKARGDGGKGFAVVDLVKAEDDQAEEKDEDIDDEILHDLVTLFLVNGPVFPAQGKGPLGLKGGPHALQAGLD